MADRNYSIDFGGLGFAVLILVLIAWGAFHSREEMEFSCLGEQPTLEQREACRQAAWGR